jgi:acetyl-CoA carboxylase carboxyltransferase component
VNAVFYNQIQATPEAERPALVAKLREEYARDVDLMLLASELVVDDVVLFERLRDELVRRLAQIRSRPEDPRPAKKHGVWPV